MKRIFLFIFVLTLLGGCAVNSNKPVVVPFVDLARYSGKWYEIASYPVSFEKGCSCIAAEYTLTDEGYIIVRNTCNKRGKLSSVTGKAFPVKGSNNAKIKVQFFWPFRGDYWIIGLAEDYSWATVSSPSRKYLWILNREKHMDPRIYDSLLINLQKQGFVISKIQKAVQDCN